MCNLYEAPSTRATLAAISATGRVCSVGEDRPEHTVGPYQRGPFIRPAPSSLSLIRGQWAMVVPGSKTAIPPAGRRYSTNNARIESVGQKPTFAPAWRRGQRCLIPAAWYQEPNWESGKNVWWRMRRADGAPWFLAGLWAEWTDPSSGEILPTYTMLTCNCDGHPLLARLHKPDPSLPADAQDKRSVIHVAPNDWDQWLHGTAEEALALVQLEGPDAFAVEVMSPAARAPKAPGSLPGSERGTPSLFS